MNHQTTAFPSCADIILTFATETYKKDIKCIKSLMKEDITKVDRSINTLPKRGGCEKWIGMLRIGQKFQQMEMV